MDGICRHGANTANAAAADFARGARGKSVTFRFRGPNDKEIAVYVEGAAKPLPMQKDDQGVWSVTTVPLAPNYYGYGTIADGVWLVDPSNHDAVSKSIVQGNILHVPDPASLPWELGAVPHGEIHRHFYRSGVAGDDRDFYVYTPPGYDPRGMQTYPVLYLLHGFGWDASSWTTVGFANVILDNLIAQGKAKPMLVVMPLCYGRPKSLSLAARISGIETSGNSARRYSPKSSRAWKPLIL
jgi:hypothetical protein